MNIVGDIVGWIIDALLSAVAVLLSAIAYAVETLSYYLMRIFMGVNAVYNVIAGMESNDNVTNSLKTALSGTMESVALSLLAIFFIMELVTKSMSVHKITFEAVIVVLLKLVLAKMIVTNSWEILGLFKSIGVNFAEEIATKASEASNWYPPGFSMSSNIITAIIRLLVSVVGLLAVFVSIFVVNIIILMRVFELYIMTAVAPIAFATLANDGLKSAGKKFFLSYAAVCLQAGIIIVIVYVGQLMMENPALTQYHTNLGQAAANTISSALGDIGGGTDAEARGVGTEEKNKEALNQLYGSLATSISQGIVPIVMGVLVGKSKSMANAVLGAA